MIKSFNKSIFEELTGLKPGHVVHNVAEVSKIISCCKKVRTKDYIFNLECKAGGTARDTATTTANWYFMLTNASVYWDVDFGQNSIERYPRVSVKFTPFVPDSPFNTEPEYLNAVPSNLVFGRSGAYGYDINAFQQLYRIHFEEAKNLLYCLWQRITFEVEAFAEPEQNVRGAVMLTGLEFYMGE